jgi:hypothetical protein
MKRIISILLILASIQAIAAQLNPPAAVKTAFKQNFPGISKVKWEKESKAGYEASFMQGDQHASASFTPAGAWIETEMGIAVSLTPTGVSENFFRKFPGSKIVQVYRIDSAKDPTYYEIEYILKGKTGEAKFSAEGKAL